MPDSRPHEPWKLVAVPAAITLAVTVLRLVGELLGWSPVLFSKAAGGGGSPIGISWLAPLFAVWFGVQLARRGQAPSGLGRAFGLMLLAVALVPLCGVVATAAGLRPSDMRLLIVFALASVAGAAIAWRAWPGLGRVLFAYAVAARVPVVLVMLLAIFGDWGTHYDAPPPGLPPMGPLPKWLLIGVLPQATVWFWFTLAFAGLFGLIAGALAARRTAATAV